MSAARCGRGRCGSFLDVLQSLFEELDDVAVVEGVENLAADAASADQAHAAQQAELMGHGGLRQAEHVGEILYTQLASEQRIEEADSCRVAEHLEGLSERADGRLVEQAGRRRLCLVDI